MLKKFFAVAAAALISVAGMTAEACGQSGSKPKAGPGPKVGAKIKDFSLKDQSGKSQQFSNMLKAGPVAIVFHRSAEW